MTDSSGNARAAPGAAAIAPAAPRPADGAGPSEGRRAGRPSSCRRGQVAARGTAHEVAPTRARDAALAFRQADKAPQQPPQSQEPRINVSWENAPINDVIGCSPRSPAARFSRRRT